MKGGRDSKAQPDIPMFAPERETMARADLAALQLARLKKVLERVYDTVSHYRSAFRAAGVTPDDLKSLDDLRRFPFTMKTDLRNHYPFGLLTVPREQIIRIHASSGTTGQPTVVCYTREDLETWGRLMARSMTAAGVRPGDVVHNAYGYGLFTGGLGAHNGAQTLGASVVPASGGNTERQVMLIEDFGARVLCATPSYALNIAEVAEREGYDLRKSNLAIGIFGAEPWSEAMRAELQERLGIVACDQYGLSEIMGPGVAGECAVAQDGLHGWEDHFLFEIIDPKSAEPLPMGERGELVITTLTKQGMPMIRYRTRDITRLTDQPCICGRTHLRIKRITGRDDDMLIIRGVNVFPSQIEAVLVGLPDIAPHYQIIVERDGLMDRITLEVEASPEAARHHERCETAAAAARHQIKTMVGVSCTVRVKGPGEVPRSEGKAVRVKDLRPK